MHQVLLFDDKLRKCLSVHYITVWLLVKRELVTSISEMELNRMENQSDIDKIVDIGDHPLLNAQAWKNTIQKASTHENQQPSSEHNVQHAFFTNIANYLHIPTTELKTYVSQNYAAEETTPLLTLFATTEQNNDLYHHINEIEKCILTLVEKMTITIYSKYTKHIREKETANRLKASFKAKCVSLETASVDEIIQKDDPISAPTMANYIQTEVNQAVKRNNNQQRDTNNKRKQPNKTGTPNNNTNKPSKRPALRFTNPNSNQTYTLAPPPNQNSNPTPTQDPSLNTNNSTTSSGGRVPNPYAKNNSNPNPNPNWQKNYNGRGRGRGRSRGNGRDNRGGRQRGRGNASRRY